MTKTSLLLDSDLFYQAKKDGVQLKKTISQVISHWAQVGRDYLQARFPKKARKKFKPVNLGKLKVDLISRSGWMDALDDTSL